MENRQSIIRKTITEIKQQNFCPQSMYESYIQYVDQNGGVKGFRLPFDNARATAFRTKIHKPDLQKSLDPVD